MIDSVIGDFFVSVLYKSKEEKGVWAFSGVYGPCDQNLMSVLWEELNRLKRGWQAPWCAGGDFSAVRCPEERLGGKRFSRHMQGFNNFIQEFGLVDLPLQGATFTWSNGRVSSRLDRFLCLVEWLDSA